MKRSRALLSIAPIAIAALLLSGCTGGGNGGGIDSAIKSDAKGKACVAAGDVSRGVTVAGEFGDQLTLTSKTPVNVKNTQRSVLIEGDTQPFADGETPNVTFTLFNGKTGETINYAPDQVVPNDEVQLAQNPVFYEAVRCGSVGQRAAIAVPVGVALGEGVDPAERGFTDLTANDTFILLFDFMKPFDEFADCATVAPRDPKFPEVDLGDGTSAPTVTIPECMAAPTEIEVKTLVAGAGPVVQDGDVVKTNYVGVMWNGGVHFQTSWDDTGINLGTQQVIEGFRKAMIGQTIGSTVVVSMPSDMAYGDGARTFVLQLVSLVE